MEEVAAVNDAAAICPIAGYENAVWDTGSIVEAVPNDFASGNTSWNYKMKVHCSKLIHGTVKRIEYCDENLPFPRAGID